MPPIVFAILTGLQAAIQEAPKLIGLAKKAKELFEPLFTGKLISKDQQDAIHARIDAISEAAQRGEIPEGWAVEPDPE